MEGKHELDPSDFFTYFYDDEFHEIAGKFCGIPEVKIQNFIRGNSNYSILKAYENVIKKYKPEWLEEKSHDEPKVIRLEKYAEEVLKKCFKQRTAPAGI